jgi:hypothetical protein
MPKATFNDFIKQNPNCKKFENDVTMQDIFCFLSQDDTVIKLIDTSDGGKPALAPMVADVENFFTDTTKTYANTLDDNFTKQAIGLMIKTILAPFGYVVWKQKDLPKNSRATKFQSASVYRYDNLNNATMKVVKRIEEIND